MYVFSTVSGLHKYDFSHEEVPQISAQIVIDSFRGFHSVFESPAQSSSRSEVLS